MDAARCETKEKIKRLKAIRTQLGWSEETCAHRLGVTYSTLNRWERGQVAPKSQVILSAIDHFIARYGQGGRHMRVVRQEEFR